MDITELDKWTEEYNMANMFSNVPSPALTDCACEQRNGREETQHFLETCCVSGTCNYMQPVGGN